MMYSLLTTDSGILLDKEYIDRQLSSGIKVIAFGGKDLCDTVKTGRKEFIDAKLLQVFECSENLPKITVSDGEFISETEAEMQKLVSAVPKFNYEQYAVEHADPYRSLIVEAGAGTGKTTVMIDRIMFLMHTVPGLSFEDIGMITFTNEATQNMKHKIQNVLKKRFQATKSSRYIRMLEDISKIRIQTIHSFSKDIISELGESIGYSQSVALRGYKYEKVNLIREVLNERHRVIKKPLADGLGGRLHELESLIQKFWTQLDNTGFSDSEIAALDWGEPEDRESKAMHETLSQLYTELNRRYNALKLENDAIAVGDIVRELRRIIEDGEDLTLKSHPLKYLFVDEFQDSDNAQIKTIAWLQQAWNLNLFVVGDVKQSIYRFRGAVETAFDQLRNMLKNTSGVVPDTYGLNKNYRTSSDILEVLDPIFAEWNKRGLIAYGNKLVAQNHFAGSVENTKVRNSLPAMCKETLSLIRSALKDCVAYAKANHKENDPSQHVTVLVRTNFQLARIGQWCNEANIPCYIQQEGTFYYSDAVRDFYSLVKAYVYPTVSEHLTELLDSSYAACSQEEFDTIVSKSGDFQDQTAYISELLNKFSFDKYRREFRFRPVLAVLREIVEELKPVRRYTAKRKGVLTAQGGWEADAMNQQLAVEAKQYEANLDKLFHILRKHFSGDMATLSQICEFLKINILTNKNEDEPDVKAAAGCGCVYGMTVHKAKGLEFDTVLIPMTHKPFRKPIDTEIIIDETCTPKRVGWSYVIWNAENTDKADVHKCNNYYNECLSKETFNIDKEEARLLYVALTRSIRKLHYFLIGDDDHSWTQLLEVE